MRCALLRVASEEVNVSAAIIGKRIIRWSCDCFVDTDAAAATAA